MAFSLDRVVPWGRSFAEYQRMFALTPEERKRRILGCADGPASFNAEATRRGTEVVSVDPIYEFSRSEIHLPVQATFPEMIEGTHQNRAAFLWTEHKSVEDLGRARMASMERFLDDYDQGRQGGRLLCAELPSLPFADQAFGLALCSHFLFLYTDHFSQSFHLESIAEMCRVAKEVRIFPLLALGGVPSQHVVPVMNALRRLGFQVTTETVEYEFQRGGNQMMRVLQRRT